MKGKYLVDNIVEALNTRKHPQITFWNRLEGRPRTQNFDRSLRAEVRDALWMLTRQWQLGEFRGDDAGSPISSKIHISTTGLTKYRANRHKVEAFEDEIPLETKAERRPIPMNLGNQVMSLDIRLLMGRQWLKLISRVGDYANQYIALYPIQRPDPNQKEDAPTCAHLENWQSFAAVAKRRMDGGLLYTYLTDYPADLPEIERPRASDHLHASNNEDLVAIDEMGDRFIQWFESLYYQPPRSGDDAWDPARLEYQFACSAPKANGETVFSADEYYHGHLDWYNVDIDTASQGLGDIDGAATPDPQSTDTQTLIPTPVLFSGMPNTRWWAFENRKTNFGDIKADTTELAKLLLIEFGLIYANDWFLMPYTLPVGSVAQIEGMTVTNVFGERFWIEAAGSGVDNDWQRWSMFTLDKKGDLNEKADTALLLLPTVPKVQEGDPLEEIVLIRDEMANMVWGIEKTIPLADGTSKPGLEAALETQNFYQTLLDQTHPNGDSNSPDYKANIRYQLMTSVPENWIPLIPVHVENDNREIQLQRAAMPRILEHDAEPPVKIRPRTVLLRQGLDQVPALPYFIHEEEVPRAGVRIKQSFQRTRWRNGEVFVWLGVRKQTGRGEGWSGLAFDRLENVEAVGNNGESPDIV
ncbi:hypothetical protein Lepto7375DRAFT_3753 [Leptolyngbya sp. PCC 7375]|nr:hypothetical protein Lepto7375DRAFT_3753 [Leptolyngbya sp. PCC 7375]